MVASFNMLEDIIRDRKEKLAKLRAEGVSAYPASVSRATLLGDADKNFDKLSSAGKKVSAAGRIIALRDQGNLIFLDLRDETGKLQIILKKDSLANYKTLKSCLDIGDFLEVAGVLIKTKKGEKSIEAAKANLISKSLRPLPSEWYGLKDAEERFRKRYLDLILNEEVREKFVARSEVIRELRVFLAKEKFLEVETPVLQPIPGGAKARPFVTHHNALNEDFYLRVAPELYLKRLLVGGFEKVFELGKVFRNEGMDRDHNPEFTMLELYWAYADYEDLMKFVGKMLSPWLPGKWETITFSELFKRHTGRNWRDVSPKELDEVYKREIRLAGKILKTTLVTDYPEAIMPLAKLKKDEPDLTESFQLIAGADVAPGGPEIVKGFSELNDPVFQREQMERQERAFRAGDEESSRLDEDFLESLEYGMPPAAGLGIGIDRLVALATKSHAVKEIILFPTMKSKE